MWKWVVSVGEGKEGREWRETGLLGFFKMKFTFLKC